MKPSLFTAATLTLVALTAALIAGCDGLMFGGSSPVALDPNFEAVERKASLFYLDTPATASPEATFSITTWVLLKPGSAGPLPKLRKFQAVADNASKTIMVTGNVAEFDLKPGKTASTPSKPMAATLSLEVSAPAGTYEIQISPDYFTTEHPELFKPDGSPLGSYPQPIATQSISIQ